MEMMTEKDWKMVDFKSRDLITQWLKTLNVKSVQETTGNCCIDLIFNTGKHIVGVEIKDRTFASDKFGDVFAEEYKLIGS